ncbi:calcium-binding protein CP1-like [Rutidosis leptorrhynchoides]|uniref:calcium-binding protein CP1-like n=1 Tax=Rutidosis leptorrhynchoides TaxID=125765 RepID=UPI003A9A47EA
MCPTDTSNSLFPARNINNLRSAFDVLDVDHDGKISREDLKTPYTDVDDDVIVTMMTVADSNKNSYVEYDEFEKVVLKRDNGRSNGVMDDVFNSIDGDGDGKVGYEDLRSYLNAAELEVNDDEIKAMIRLGGCDSDSDGVTFDEFLKILAI